MPRLPNPGQDSGSWGDILNEYLKVDHNADGTPKSSLGLNAKTFGAIADAENHPLSEKFKTLAEAQAVYPHASALSDTIDWAAIQAVINKASGVLKEAVYLPGGIYAINRPIQIVDVRGFHLAGAGTHVTRLHGVGGMDTLLDINGAADCLFENFVITNDGKKIDKMVHLYWDPTKAKRSTTGNTFRSIKIVDGVFRVGFALGTNDGTLQCDGTSFYDCAVNGDYVAGTNDDTKPQYGWLMGSGAFGNNLNHYLFNSGHAGVKYGVYADACNFYVYGAQPGGAEVDYFVAGATGPVVLAGIRSEISARLFESNVSNSNGLFHIMDCNWTAQLLNKDGKWIKHQNAGRLLLDNVNIQYVPPGVTPIIEADSPGHLLSVVARGLSAPLPLEQCFKLGPKTNLLVEGYLETYDSGPQNGHVKSQTLFYSNQDLQIKPYGT